MRVWLKAVSENKVNKIKTNDNPAKEPFGELDDWLFSLSVHSYGIVGA